MIRNARLIGALIAAALGGAAAACTAALLVLHTIGLVP